MTSQSKYARVAAMVRAQVAEGVLQPGEPAPSGAALARTTGYSTMTCRKALRMLVKDGVLAPGHSANARPRVAVATPTGDNQGGVDASRALSATLAARRRAACLTQPDLSARIGVSVTTVGHAETGRLWQARGFWERADKVLDADGELLRLHDAYRAAVTEAHSPRAAGEVAGNTTPMNVCTVSSVTVTWSDGRSTTVYPPAS